jgi:hypothetical protein
MSERNGIQRPISIIELRSALHELFVFLEEPFQRELLRELNAGGINLLRSSSYTLAEVEEALYDIFGDYGTELIMEKLREILRRQLSNRSIDK